MTWRITHTVWNPHNFGCGIWMIKCTPWNKFRCFLIQGNYLNLKRMRKSYHLKGHLYNLFIKNRMVGFCALTLLLYSSTKLPRANLKRLSGRIDQFMLYTVHGASYLYISLRFPGGGGPRLWPVTDMVTKLWDTKKGEILRCAKHKQFHRNVLTVKIQGIQSFKGWRRTLCRLKFDVSQSIIPRSST